MSWYTPVLLRLVFEHFNKNWLVKKLVGQSSAERFFLTFLFSATLTALVALWSPSFAFESKMFWVATVAFVTGFGTFAHWKAIDLSLSRTSLCTFFDDIIAMSLAYFITNDGVRINRNVWFGIIVCLGATIALSVRGYKKTDEKKFGFRPLLFFGYVSFYSVFWGFSIFFLRFMALKEMPAEKFVFGWYMGIGVSSAVIYLIARKFNGKQIGHPRQSPKAIFLIALLAVNTIISMWLNYKAMSLAPLLVVQPIFLVAEMVIPAIVGLFMFGERRGLKWWDWLLYLTAIFGGGLISLNFK